MSALGSLKSSYSCSNSVQSVSEQIYSRGLSEAVKHIPVMYHSYTEINEHLQPQHLLLGADTFLISTNNEVVSVDKTTAPMK